MRHRPPVAVLALPLAVVAACTPGCVTEVTPVTPGASRNATVSPGARSGQSSTPTPKTAPQLPSGPVARAVTPDASVSAQVRTVLLDLGTIPYDGQVLPLVSPDGRFVATQTGAAPTWPTLIAAPGAEVPHATQIRAYALPDPEAAVQPGVAPAATPITWSEPRTGLLLGRSADTTGFLVESPQPDGARWIGRISWVSGQLDWLVQTAHVNSGATLGPAGELAFCRREIDSTVISLVVRASPGAPEIVAGVPGAAGARASGAYFWPMCSDEPGIVYAFALAGGGAEVHALRLPRAGDPPVLAIVGRQPLARNADATSLSQVVACAQTPLPARLTTPGVTRSDTQSGTSFDKILFFHPGMGRMVAYDRRTAAIVPLFPGSVGATPLYGEPTAQTPPVSGYLVTMPKSLEYVAWSQRSEFDERRGVPASTEQGVEVMAGAQVARLTTSVRWPVVLTGPDSGGQSGAIHLFRLRLEGVSMDARGR
jgi:hypothetical protein